MPGGRSGWAGQEAGECGYKRAAGGLLVVMELLCIVTVVVDTGAYACTEIERN